MKKILIVADLRGWVFERHALEIQKRLSHKYDIEIGYCRGSNVAKQSEEKDLIYIMDPMPTSYVYPDKTIMGLRCEWLYENNPRGAIGLYEDGHEGIAIKPRCSMLHVVNNKQLSDFKHVVVDKPLIKVQHGVDETVFDANKYNRPEYVGPLRIGFVGRGRSPGKKGFNEVTNVCKRLGYEIKSASYEGKKRTKEEMPEFYADLDVLVCFSKTEGHNNVIMEAGAMGVPVISTSSGSAAEIMQNGQSGLLIDREYSQLYNALQFMSSAEDRDLFGKALYMEIMKNWTWEVKIKEYEDMFDTFLEEASC